MRKVRNIIRKYLNEIFDSFKLPDEYTEEDDVFYFKFKNLTYYVRFTPFYKASKIMVEDEKILNIINNVENKFVVDFGIMNNGRFEYFIKAKTSHGIELLRFVGGIILKFCEEKNVNVLSYVPNSETNDKLFNLMSKNPTLNNYFRYRKKELQPYSVFLILKKLIINSNEETKN